jgi:hypothetical protein
MAIVFPISDSIGGFPRAVYYYSLDLTHKFLSLQRANVTKIKNPTPFDSKKT